MSSQELGLLQSKLEAILFVSNDPISAENLAIALGAELSLIKKALKELKKTCESLNRGIELKRVACGYQFRTKREHAEIIRTTLQAPAPYECSPAMIEVLAIVAYRGPVSRLEIEQIRGSNSFYLLTELLEAGFIEVIGKSQFEAAHLYRATQKFLLTFGIADFESLPPLPKIDEKYAPTTDKDDELSKLKGAIQSLLTSYPDLQPDPLQEARDQELLDAISKQIARV